jgi:cyclophilin family peptidyl-prolyl cis-trans isomerase
MHCAAVLLALAQTAGTGAGSPARADQARPWVALDTSMGRIVVELRPDKAPRTVDNFIKYVRAGHYDHTIFHRVVRGFVIQGGGYEEDLSEHPTRASIRNESVGGLSNVRGTVAMARSEAPDSARAQFFINLGDNSRLDGRPGHPGYTVFGEVVEGMEVVDRIAALPNQARRRFDKLTTPIVTIRRAREIESKRPRPTPTPEVTPPTVLSAPEPDVTPASPVP